MNIKTSIGLALMFSSSAALAWPPIPKLIASGEGIYNRQGDGKNISFQWAIGMSVAKKQNIYIDIAVAIDDKDKKLIEKSDCEIILYDNDSTLFRIKVKAPILTTREVVENVTSKLTKTCPNLRFDLNTALYGNRP